MSSNSHQEIEVLQDRLEESQRQLTRAQEDNEKKEKTLRGWTILAKTARKRIEVLEKQSRDCDNWKATAHRHKHELEALKLRTTREANKRERDLAQVEQGLRETIEQELRERIEQESRAAVMEEHKANYVCRKRKQRATRKAGNGVQKAKKAPVQTLASTRRKRTFPSKYKR